MLPLIEIFNDLGWIFDDIGTLVWFLFFSVCFLAMLIIPNFFVYQGIVTVESHKNKLSSSAQAGLWFILGILGTIMLWWIFPAMAELFDYTWLTNLFWVSLFIHWILSIPVVSIIKFTNIKV